MSDPRPAPAQLWMTIPAGTATLGKLRSEGTFGWDNEFGTLQISVPEFSIGAFPVTNGEYMEFVQACGYEDSRYWRPEDRSGSASSALIIRSFGYRGRIQQPRIPTHSGNTARCSE